MRLALVRFLSLVAVIVSSSIHAYADSWIQPTPEELQMTAEPAAPGAAAIYLYLEEFQERVLDRFSFFRSTRKPESETIPAYALHEGAGD